MYFLTSFFYFIFILEQIEMKVQIEDLGMENKENDSEKRHFDPLILKKEKNIISSLVVEANVSQAQR